MAKNKADEKSDVSVEEKLRALYQLQLVDTKIDKIKTVRGELPLEVSDLEDVVAGLETRFNNFTAEIEALEQSINDKKNAIKDAQSQIKKYTEQQGKVRNNREYDSITKEIEFQNLEIQLAEKRMKEAKATIAAKAEMIESAKTEFNDKKKDLKHKKEELDEIVAETQKEEDALLKKSKTASALIEERLLTAYKRIRSNAKNGLAVVSVQRDACGGCFNKIPPQRQLDIRMRKKILVCEHCGRILVDAELVPEVKDKEMA
ncbi:MAG: hypothetical protein J0M08_08040 [Bacteroidetes bacterium]|nr:hypothetical protein [Bacteroidota bacterium]